MKKSSLLIRNENLETFTVSKLELKKNFNLSNVTGGIQPSTYTSSTLSTVDFQNLKEVECGGDGYCGYKCLSYILLGHPQHYKDVISDICQYLRDHPDVFIYFAEARGIFNDSNIPNFDLHTYIDHMRRHINRNTQLPVYLWLNDLGIQVVTMIYNVNVIIQHKPQSESCYQSRLVKGRRIKQHSVVLKNETDLHWKAIIPSSTNVTKEYPISQSILENNLHIEDFQVAPQVHSQETTSQRVATFNFARNRNVFVFRTNVNLPSLSNSSQDPSTENNKNYWEETFRNFNTLQTRNKCPSCSFPVSSYRSYCAHLRQEKCETGKYFTKWKSQQTNQKTTCVKQQSTETQKNANDANTKRKQSQLNPHNNAETENEQIHRKKKLFPIILSKLYI